MSNVVALAPSPLVALLATLFGAFLALPALAQEHSSEEPATQAEPHVHVVAPRLIHEEQARGPRKLKRPAVVGLKVEVSSAGSVNQSIVLPGQDSPTGPQPGAVRSELWAQVLAAAKQTATKLVFTPAMRDGVPVAAWVRVQVWVRPPPPSARATVLPAASPPAAYSQNDAPREPELNAGPPEIVIADDALEPDSMLLSADELAQLPGAMGDPFRAIEAMPGVTPMVSGLPYFFVRGSPPGNVGYFVDGIRLPQLFHMGLGPGVLPAGLIDSVQLYSGAYPAHLGRYSGGVVEASLAPAKGKRQARAQLRLTDIGVLAESPVFDTQTNVLVGGRYSFIEPLMKLAAPVVPIIPDDLTLSYWDYQLRADRHLSANTSLRLLSFGSSDRYGNEGLAMESEFHRIDVKLEHLEQSGTTATYALTVGQDRTVEDDSIGEVRDRTANLRASREQALGPSLTLRNGVETRLDSYTTLARPLGGNAGGPKFADSDNFKSVFISRLGIVGGLYSELNWQATRSISVHPGIRGDVHASQDATAIGISPRLSAEFQLTPSLSAHHAVGLAHQAPAFVVPVPGLQLGTLDEGLQRSVQSSAGVKSKLPLHTSGSLTLFNNAFFNSTDALGLSNVPKEYDHEQRTRGRAVGIELLLRREAAQRLSGFISYTLSHSERAVGRFKAPAAWDRRHMLNVVGGYKWARGIRTSARLVFYTGRPPDLIAPPNLDNLGAETAAQVVKLKSAWKNQLNSLQDSTSSKPTTRARTAPFYRLDLRAEKRWTFSNRSWLSLFIEVLNATANPEEFDMDCLPNGHCTVDSLGPLTIPNIGIELGL